MESVEIAGTSHAVKPPIHPIRYRLHQGLTDSGGSHDTFAALCAVLGACCGSILGLTPVEVRDAVRGNIVDFGELVMDALIESGATMDEVSQAALAVSRFLFGLAPTDGEIDEAANFTKEKKGVSTTSTSA